MSGRPVTVAEMRERAAELRCRAGALEEHSSRRFDTAPGAAVTGGSGRRRSGLHKRTERAIDGSFADLARAKVLRESATKWEARADRRDPEVLAAEASRRERRDAARAEVKRRESVTRKAAPILNRPAAPHRLTSAEWAATHRDFKGVSAVEIAGAPYRLRSCMQAGALGEVYLTDKPDREATA